MHDYPGDHLIRAITPDGRIRVVAAITTTTVREAAHRQKTQHIATVALGRAATAGLLLATLTKGGERVTVQILGDGPLRGITIDANDQGNVRGYVGRPEVEGNPGPVAPWLGKGIVHVVRDLGLNKDSQYGGQSEIVSGEVDLDVEHYLQKSEQIESALGCEVIWGDGGQVAVAGGVLVQCLPSGDVSAVADARERIRGGLARVLGEAGDAAGIARAIAGEVTVLDTRPVRFFCPCSAQRIEDTLGLLGDAELQAMIREDHGAEITCNFCNAVYRVSEARLEEIRRRLA
jgi:molecular chaperone Hsp33